MIFNKHQCIFVHIPKCAGSSIARVLVGGLFNSVATNYHMCSGWDGKNKIWMQHATAAQINTFYPDKFNKYFKFAIVRNPWDRALSDYFWMQDELKVRDSFKNFLLLEGKFNDRRLKFPMLNSESRADHLIPQYKFIYNDKEERLVDLVCKFENLQSDFNMVCQKIGMTQQTLPHTNKRAHKHYTEYYDDETKQIVAKRYAKDIEYFGYEFGE